MRKFTGVFSYSLWCTMGLVVLAFTIGGGLSPCGADTTYDYTYNEHLWATTITTNSNDDIEYVVSMPGRTDFNLYVRDTWTEEWSPRRLMGAPIG